mgnify:CR=1 FL=1
MYYLTYIIGRSYLFNFLLIIVKFALAYIRGRVTYSALTLRYTRKNRNFKANFRV